MNEAKVHLGMRVLYTECTSGVVRKLYQRQQGCLV
jgi:hypothetical protein